MYRPLSYALKIWLTAVLACPVLIALYIAATTYRPADAFYAFLLCMGVGAVFSLPSLLLLWLAIYLLRYNDKGNYLHQKLALSVICLVLTWLSFFFFDGAFSIGFIFFMVLYAAGTIVGVWVFDLHPTSEYAAEEADGVNEEAA